MKEDKKINFGLILGVCLGGFSWYVSAVSNIAVHFYWFLPVIAAGNVYFTCTMSYCVYYCSMDLYCSIPLSTHTSPSIQYSCIHSLSSSVSIPLSLSSSSSSISSPAGLSCTNVLLYSFGFIFSVIVFPIGLVLWMLSCCGVFSEDSDDSSHTSYSSPHNSTSECMQYSVILYLELVFFIVTNCRYPTDHRPIILHRSLALLTVCT